MLAKLLSLLLAGKGGAVAAAAIVAGVTTVNVSTTQEVQQGLREVAAAVSTVTSPGMSELAKLGKVHDECERGQPVLVAQRNAADKLLRDAYQASYKELNDLKGGTDVDHQKANEILKDAREDLREVLRASLNGVAALTLGREGQLKDKDADDEDADEDGTPSPSPTLTTLSPSPSPSSSPSASPSASESPTPKPTCAPKPSASPEASASPSGSPAAEQRGRLAVARRVSLDASLTAIVEDAKTDMRAIVDTAKGEVSKLEPVERGKSGEKGRSEAQPGKADDRGKPSDKPGGKQSSPPGRP